MKRTTLIHDLIDFADRLGQLVEDAHRSLSPDQNRVVDSNAEKVLVTLQRLSAQVSHLEDQIYRFKGSPPTPPPAGRIYAFDRNKQRPSKGPGKRR